MKVYHNDGSKKGGVSSAEIKLNKGFNNDSYLNLLENRAFPSIKSKITNFIFMHDNAPIHTKKLNRTEQHSLAWNLIVRIFKSKLLKWPPYSPDLNPLENVWSLLDRAKNDELDRRARLGIPLPKNKKESFELLKKCWAELDNEIVKKIYFSFRNRLINVLFNRGGNNFSTRTRN